MPAPTANEVIAYLGDQNQETWDTPAITAALAAELAAQAQVCIVPTDPEAVWPRDLAEALLRRVAHNLAVRGLPLGAQPSIDGSGSSVRVSGYDAEVGRFEAPYRRIVVG